MELKLTESPSQITELDALTLIEGTTTALTMIVIPEEVTVEGLAHAALDVKIQVTTSPSNKVDEVKVAKFVPAFVPFICH